MKIKHSLKISQKIFSFIDILNVKKKKKTNNKNKNT